MKTLIVLMTLVSSIQAGAATVLLNCNTDFAHDQEVSVVEDGGKLFFRELTRSGSWQSRELSQAEWQSGRIAMRTSREGEKGVFYRSGKSWMYEVTGMGRSVGYADCRR